MSVEKDLGESNYNEKFINKKKKILTFNYKNTFPSLNVSVFDL